MHIQQPVNDWPNALLKMPDYSVVKSVDNPSLLREAKQRWAAAGRDPAKLWTIYRHFNVHTAPRSNWNNALDHWRRMYARWVDATYLREYASYVDFVSESNEYTSDTTWASPEEKFFALQNVRAAAHVWRNDYQGKTVQSADGGQGLIPESCRLALLAGTVANTIPREVFEIALTFDYPIDYHAYTFYPGGVRAADDWANHSGRWDRHERQYGLKPRWLFGESGPYVDRGGGWRVCLGGDENRLVTAMQAWWRDCATTAAYREGRLIGAGCWFTSGGASLGWPDYELETPQLINLADALRPMWRPGVLAPPVPPAPAKIIDVSRHQGVINWDRVKAAGVETVIIRATMGATGVDSEYARNWRNSAVAGISHRGMYHYVITEDSATAQVANIRAVTHDDFGNEPLTLDCEPRSDEGVFSQLQRQAYTFKIRQMLDLLAVHTRVRIYTRASAWVWLTTLPAWAEGVVDWFAHYNTAVLAPDLPPGVTTWKRWQYSFTGQVAGIDTNVDLNRDNAAPAPPPTGELTMTQRQVVEKKHDEIWVALNPKVKAANPCGLYYSPGGALIRTLTDGRTMDVFNKAGPWLLVTQAPNPIFWVKQTEVIQL